MKQIDKILLACGEYETSLKDLADMLGWNKGSTSIAINQLIERGYMEKTRYGIYKATKKGHKNIKKILDKEQKKDNVDYVAYRTAALFTVDARFSMIKTLKYEKESRKPTLLTKKLGDVFKKVYIESVNLNHQNDFDMIKSMWRNHNAYTCTSCNFNFNLSYETCKKEIEEIISKTPFSHKFSKAKLFRNLRWESFSDIEKYKRNFGLSDLDIEMPGE